MINILLVSDITVTVTFCGAVGIDSIVVTSPDNDRGPSPPSLYVATVTVYSV